MALEAEAPRVPSPAELRFAAVPGLPLIEAGDDLAGLLVEALDRAGLGPAQGDVLCIAQKVVSKAEGRAVPLAAVRPGAEAIRLAEETGKDPRLAQLVLDESSEVLRKRPGILIVRHRLGFVCANAGIDQSNIGHEDGERALLLPEDPDRSAAGLRARLQALTGKCLGLIVTDSHNRPWRLGTLGMAIGAAGLKVLDDRRGERDLYGRALRVTMSNRADALAAGAALLMGETTERMPAVLIRGLAPESSADHARLIDRPLAQDLFR